MPRGINILAALAVFCACQAPKMDPAERAFTNGAFEVFVESLDGPFFVECGVLKATDGSRFVVAVPRGALSVTDGQTALFSGGWRSGQSGNAPSLSSGTKISVGPEGIAWAELLDQFLDNKPKYAEQLSRESARRELFMEIGLSLRDERRNWHRGRLTVVFPQLVRSE